MALLSEKKLLAALSDPRLAAEAAGLVYASPDETGYARRRAGRGFVYVRPDGGRVSDAEALARIRTLAIPPAWSNVWICANPNGHLQATGRDDKGRRQYRYHARFRETRDSAKFEHLVQFGQALPDLRSRMARDMALPGLGRQKVLATVVHLLETTLIRVGNAAYARENQSYGLTTLRARHVAVDGAELRFHFKGKSGRLWTLSLHDRRVARIVRQCQDMPGQHLFQYVDDAGARQAVSSADVNDYLREATGADITAKDFRTWTGTVLAAGSLAALGRPASAVDAKSAVRKTIEMVAARLGNTPTICRKCYVHPHVLATYAESGLALAPSEIAGLEPEEAALLAFLRGES